MLLLAVDTSGKNGSLGLAGGTGAGNPLEIVEEVALAGGTFSAQLVPQIASLLEKHGSGKVDLAGFAVVSGPGSFTGLRVGLAAIKALAEILRKPIAAVSLLEAVARSGAGQGHVFSVLDAGRGDFYVGDYKVGQPVRMHSERLLCREDFFAESKDQLVLTPVASIADAARSAGFRVELVAYPRSGEIARLGWERIQRGETVLPENLEANYMRHSDAEIFSKPKL
jgi:tRNA threonylcarbamoyladenosine biosynthesis protein TsaB